MPKRMLRLLCCLGLALCLQAIGVPGAWAHRVNVFAVVEGGTVHVDCFYSKSNRVKAGKVSVFDAVTGEKFLDGVTDAGGKWSFPVPEAAIRAGHGLRIVLEAGEGHRNEGIVEAREFGGASPGGGVAASAVAPGQAAVSAPAASAPAISGQELAALVEQAVDRVLESRLAPIRRILAEEQERGPGLTEIVGGIGWIIGIFGMAAWARSRR